MLHLAKRCLSTLSRPIQAFPGKNSQLSVVWEKGEKLNYPAIWLRDNCQCSKCYSPSALARLTLMRNLDVDVEIKSAKVINDDQVIFF